MVAFEKLMLNLYNQPPLDYLSFDFSDWTNHNSANVEFIIMMSFLAVGAALLIIVFLEEKNNNTGIFTWVTNFPNIY